MWKRRSEISITFKFQTLNLKKKNNLCSALIFFKMTINPVVNYFSIHFLLGTTYLKYENIHERFNALVIVFFQKKNGSHLNYIFHL